MRELWQIRAQIIRHGGIIKATKAGRHHQHLAFGEPQHEAQFAFAENHHQRIADGAKFQASQMQDGKFPPIRQLKRNHITAPNAACPQTRRNAVGKIINLRIGEAGFRAKIGSAGNNGGLTRMPRHGAIQMMQQRFITPEALGAHGGTTNGDIISLHGHSFLLHFQRASLRPFFQFWRAYCTATRPTFSRATISFMICAVPSPISRPITSRRRC